MNPLLNMLVILWCIFWTLKNLNPNREQIKLKSWDDSIGEMELDKWWIHELVRRCDILFLCLLRDVQNVLEMPTFPVIHQGVVRFGRPYGTVRTSMSGRVVWSTTCTCYLKWHEAKPRTWLRLLRSFFQNPFHYFKLILSWSEPSLHLVLCREYSWPSNEYQGFMIYFSNLEAHGLWQAILRHLRHAF